MTDETQADESSIETLDSVKEDRERAAALEELAERLSSAESIADDVPLLSGLFHQARTSGGRRVREGGSWVLLVDYDGYEFSPRSLHWLEQGTHLRDTGADAKIKASPHPFQSVDEFKGVTKQQIERKARAIRQNAQEKQHAHEEKERLKQRHDGAQ